MTAYSVSRPSLERNCWPTGCAYLPQPQRLGPIGPTPWSADWSSEADDDDRQEDRSRDGSLESWVRDRAFRQHCALFGKRPFLWHISDGLRDGFSVFVHYHRFDQANLRKLTYTLLGDWLARAKAENNALRYEKGRELQQKLENILEGENPYDIFVRWKSLAQQPLGWDPDLDDGVRQNIRPFIMAGVLTHDLSKILKDKDRGRDVSLRPPGTNVFNGERRNDHHTTLAEKRAAHEAAAEAGGGREVTIAARRPYRRRPRRCELQRCGRGAAGSGSVVRREPGVPVRSSRRCANNCQNC